MNEIEVKILDINKEEIIKKIKQLGAILLFENKEFNAIYYKSPEHETIIIRKEGDLTVICHKQKIKSSSGIKSMKETEIETKDFDNSLKLLEKLGLKKKDNNIYKTRTSYKLNNCKIEFDKMHQENEFVPEFLEIEATNEEDLYKMIQILGFTKKETCGWNQHKVIEYYNQK